MRPLAIAVLPAALAAMLAGCASAGSGRGLSAANEMQQLRADCEARGGFLVPSGAATGRIALDNVCKINDPPGLTR